MASHCLHFILGGNGGLQRSRYLNRALRWTVPVLAEGTLPVRVWGGGWAGTGGPGKHLRWSSGPGREAEPAAGEQAGITCCGGRRSAAAGRARAPGPAVPEVAVGPPARTPGRPRPIGAVDGPEEAGGA